MAGLFLKIYKQIDEIDAKAGGKSFGVSDGFVCIEFNVALFCSDQ